MVLSYIFMNIIFSAEKPETAVVINGSKYFSPNGDGINDTIKFDVTIPTPRSVVNSLSSWSIAVIGDDNKVYYEQKGTNNPLSSFVFNGAGANGSVLPEGEYKLRVSAKYGNGYEPPLAYSAKFVLDNTAPNALVKPSVKVFNGSNSLLIVQRITSNDAEYTGPKNWTGAIKDANGNVVKQYDFGTVLSETISWDGTNSLGAFASDGSYHYELQVSDLAGNKNTIVSDPFTLDTTQTELMLSVTPEAFSPNGDNVQDTVTFRPVAKASSGIDKYTVKVMDSEGNLVRTFTGRNQLPSSIVWDGRSDSGSLCPDGRYEVSFNTVAHSGTEAQSQKQYFTIDTKAPEINISVPYTAFSPDGLPEEQSKQQVIPVNVQNSSSENKWSVNIANKAGQTVRTIDIQKGEESSALKDFTWDGTDDNGNRAPNGNYTITVSSTDAAGNKASAVISDILLDNREAKAYITTKESDFAPNGDGVKDEQTFTIRSTLTEGIKSWSFSVADASGNVVQEWNQDINRNLPQTVVWDGKTKNGTTAEGVFTGKLHIEYNKGNIVDAVSPSFICTTTAPALEVVSSANPEQGRYFSPDNDGNEDELTMELICHTLVEVKSWTLTIKNSRNDGVFWKTSGKSMTSSKNNTYSANITWDGRGNNGETVMSAEDYPYEYTVTDTLGMTSTYTGYIPVDVLVVLDGGYLKMQVPSIVFRGDAADFKLSGEVDSKGNIIEKSSVTPEQKANNERVLNRIAQILRKFNNYNVTIVGHANPTNPYNGPETNNPEENRDGPWGRGLKALSLERAEYVKTWLVKEGRISSSRLTAEGKGGLETIADKNDMDNRWKNRRVEFILQK